MTADENTWTLKHSGALDTVLWLTSWIRSGLIHITLNDLLTLDEAYPDLMRDIDLSIWQIELIKAQIKDG